MNLEAGCPIKDHGGDAPRNRFGLERLREKVSDTNGHSQMMTLQQAVKSLRISKAHLSNVNNGKVAGVPPLRHARPGRRILIKREWADVGGDGSRRSKVFGRCSQLGEGEAEAILYVILQPINSGVTQLAKPIYTFERFTKEVYLPFCRRSWKDSTAGTSEQIVKTHLLSAFGPSLLHTIRREEMQDFLDRKALELSPARLLTCDGS
jgi:hypothetical protein